jgi:alpha-glucosidase (family GH31 glycosyl hydrolase)
VALSKKFIAIHEDYAPMIIQLAQDATKSGLPINRPIWWNDPEDQEALEIDSGLK